MGFHDMRQLFDRRTWSIRGNGLIDSDVKMFSQASAHIELFQRATTLKARSAIMVDWPNLGY